MCAWFFEGSYPVQVSASHALIAARSRVSFFSPMRQICLKSHMIVYEKEINVKVWLNKGNWINPVAGRTGHTAAMVREIVGNDIVAAYISWWPAEGDENSRKLPSLSGKLQTRSADPNESYLVDKRSETGRSTNLRWRRHIGYQDAKARAESIFVTYASLPDYQEQMAYVSDQKINLDKELAQLKKDKKTIHAEALTYYLSPVLTALQKRGNYSQDGNAEALMPAEREQDTFIDEANQKGGKDDKGRDIILTLSDAKRCIPGMYARVCLRRSSQGKLSPNSIEAKDREEIENFIKHQEYAYWGLNLVAIAKAWTDFLNSQTHGYKFASKSRNCSGVVWEMLLAGGIECFIEPKKEWLYRTPSDVNNAVATLATTLLEVNRQTLEFKKAADVAALFATNDTDLVASSRGTNRDLMSLDQFKSLSKSPNTFSMRREQVAIIDSNLSSYHKASWNPDYRIRLKHLFTMFKAILEHRRLKPTSDRRVGVDKLGVQILKLIESDLMTQVSGNLQTAIAGASQTQKSRAIPPGRALKK